MLTPNAPDNGARTRLPSPVSLPRLTRRRRGCRGAMAALVSALGSADADAVLAAARQLAGPYSYHF